MATHEDLQRSAWAHEIRKDIPKFSDYLDTLTAIADGIEGGVANATLIKLISKLPVRVQDAVVPMSMLSYVLDNRKAYMRTMKKTRTAAPAVKIPKIQWKNMGKNVYTAVVPYTWAGDEYNGPKAVTVALRIDGREGGIFRVDVKTMSMLPWEAIDGGPEHAPKTLADAKALITKWLEASSAQRTYTPRVAGAMSTQKLYARVARVRARLARHVTANAAAVDVIVTLPDTNGVDGERHYTAHADTSRTYVDFLDSMLADLSQQTGQEVGLADVEESGNKTPLRVYLETKTPPRHDATGLFYDYIESQYRWNSWQDASAISKDAYGFAGTPFTWDYYADDAALADTYSTVIEHDEDAYTTNDDGEEMLKPVDELASLVSSVLENDSSVISFDVDQLVRGDYFIIRYA